MTLALIVPFSIIYAVTVSPVFVTPKISFLTLILNPHIIEKLLPLPAAAIEKVP